MNFGNLLHWAIIFLVIALVAALLGFGGLAGTAMEGARILFWVAIVLAVIAFLFNFMRASLEPDFISIRDDATPSPFPTRRSQKRLPICEPCLVTCE